MLSQLKQNLMLPQLLLGGIETLFNQLLNRSPHTAAQLRKLAGKVLHIELNSPQLNLFLLFSEKQSDWLSVYEGEADCAVSLSLQTLPKLAKKRELTELINNQSLILKGDIEVLQHFASLLEGLEKDPAELLSPLLGDVAAQASTDLASKLFQKAKKQAQTNQAHLVENLLQERPVLVHRLQLLHFYDEVEALNQRLIQLEEKIKGL
ncbi:hypothetical protein A4G20_09635 [Pasteurellaceae bacterium RH1A]|nr:hypothetical protein A4G20_09635 [Pasteurellaceae bacterium RH1A]